LVPIRLKKKPNFKESKLFAILKLYFPILQLIKHFWQILKLISFRR